MLPRLHATIPRHGTTRHTTPSHAIICIMWSRVQRFTAGFSLSPENLDQHGTYETTPAHCTTCLALILRCITDNKSTNLKFGSFQLNKNNMAQLATATGTSSFIHPKYYLVPQSWYCCFPCVTSIAYYCIM